MKLRAIARSPDRRNPASPVKILVLAAPSGPDEDAYVFSYTEAQPNIPMFDNWFDSVPKAKEFAKRCFGVLDEDWQAISEES